ncbi:MAG: HD domain-containing protein [Firmicutes bacterium]|nr:HD domain-containing protein [Bacillota bacterium]
MSRLEMVREKVNEVILNMEKQSKIPSAFAHLYGVSLAATMIAKKRGEDVELASIAGMLHDIQAYKSGSYNDHAHIGASVAKELLVELNQFSTEEIEKICSAIFNHDDKELIHSSFDEVLKDADVIHHTLNDTSKDIKEKEKERYQNLMKEFELD